MRNTPPVANKIPFQRIMHGDVRIDHYDWLKDPKNPEVLQVLKGENRYFESYFSDENLRLKQQIVEEIKTKIEEETTSVEVRYGNHVYFTKLLKGENYKRRFRRHISTGVTELLLDENEQAEKHDYYAVRSFKISPNLKKIAWCIDTEGSGKCAVSIQDLETKEMATTTVTDVPWGAIAWAPDSQSFFYVQANQSWRPDSVWRYQDGKKFQIFSEPNELFNAGLSLSSDSRVILVRSSSFSHIQSFYWTGSELSPVFLTGKDTLTWTDHSEIGFVVLSNHRHKNFGIYTLEKTGQLIDDTVEIIAPKENTKIVETTLCNASIAYLARYNGLDGLYVWNAETGEKRINFEESIYAIDISGVGDPKELIVHYSSPSTAEKWYRLDERTLTLSLKKEMKPPGLKSDLYRTELRQVRSRDGRDIPVHLVHRRDLDLSKPRPVLLYGYGSYSFTVPSRYDESLFSLLDRGFIYVSAHVRGCDANGEEWYEDGKLLRKKNTFNDFVDVSDYLIASRLTSPDFLAISGASAGGLLVGATLNQKPGNFRAAIAEVPFVDALTTMLDPDMPLTTQEYLQWGNPNEREVYDYIKSYSPYDNIGPQAHYPAIFVKTGIYDLQVSYREPAKWVQKLRELTGSKHPILMKVNMTAGHGGASGRYKYYEETAEKLVFLLNEIKNLHLMKTH